MVKKKSDKTKIDNDLNFDDLSDLDSDSVNFDNLSDLDPLDRNPSKPEVAKEFLKDTGKSFLGTLVKETSKKALPSEYTNNYYELMDFVDFSKNTFDKNKNKVETSLFRLGKEVKKILPFQVKLLDKFLTNYEDKIRDVKQKTEEDLRESSIQSNLSSIFDKQLEIQKVLEARRDAENKVESKERITNNKLNFDILTNINNNIASNTAFTLQISKEYYRKSLELQFKSYFIQADMLKTMKEYYKGFSIQYDSIIKNTGLPEFVKLKNTEKIKDIVRTHLVESTFKNIYDRNKYIETIKNNITRSIDEKVSSVTSTLDSATDLLGAGSLLSPDKGNMSGGFIGSILSSELGGLLGRKVSGKISPKIKDRIKDNKYINTGANYLSILANSPSTLFSLLKGSASKKQNEYTSEPGITNKLKSKAFGGIESFLNLTNPGSQNFSVTAPSVLSHNSPAIFDNKVHRSITEIIPMYLSKILKENTDLRVMYHTVNSSVLNRLNRAEELHYDYENRKLVSSSELIDNVKNSVLSDRGSLGRLKTISNTLVSGSIRNLSKNKKENKSDINFLNDKKIGSLLEEYLKKASNIDSIKFDYDTLIEKASEGKGPTELNNLLKDSPELLKALNLLKKSTNVDTSNFISSQLSDIKKKYPIYGIKKLINDTSKIAGSSIYNNINDEQAEVLSKAFTMFITDIGKDIDIDNIYSGEAFRFLTKGQFEKLKDVLSIFLSEVKTIKHSRDILKESSLGVLLGIVNKSLKENFEVNPEVFQTLYDYSPLLGKKGKLTVENLIEKKITSNLDTDFINLNEITSNLNITPEELITKKVNIATSDILSGLKKYTPDIKINIEEIKKNPLNLVKNIVDSLKNITSEIRTKTKAKYDSLASKINDLKLSLNISDKESLQKSLTDMINKLQDTITSLDEMVSIEKNNKAKEIDILTNTRNKVNDSFKDKKSISEIDKLIETKRKEYDINIRTLEKFKEILNAQLKELLRIISSTLTDEIESLKEVRNNIKSTLDKTKSLINEIESQLDSLS